MRGRTDGLLAIPQAVGQSRRQSGVADFFLRRRNVVLEPVQLDQVLIKIEGDVAGLGLPIAGLSDGADIEKILAANFQLDAGVQAALDSVGPPHKTDGNMRVSVEANLGVMIVKAIGSGELVENVRPFLRQIERGVDDGKALDLPDIFQVAQPGPLFFAQLFPGPPDGFGGQNIKTGQIHVAGAVLVMIPHDGRTIERPDEFQAFAGIGPVTDDITQTDIVRALLLLRVGEDGLQSFEVAMNIAENGKFHDYVSHFGNSRAGAGLSSRFSSRPRANQDNGRKHPSEIANQSRISKPINSLVAGRQVTSSVRI